MYHEARGCVRWPTSNPDYEDSGEGGLWVALVVFSGGDSWRACCIDTQVPLGRFKNKRFMEPNCHSGTCGQLVLGSTNMALWNKRTGEYFQATYDDLTEKGKALFDLVRDIHFPSCDVAIVTFLDT